MVLAKMMVFEVNPALSHDFRWTGFGWIRGGRDLGLIRGGRTEFGGIMG
jgi:hypothetical protein